MLLTRKSGLWLANLASQNPNHLTQMGSLRNLNAHSIPHFTPEKKIYCRNIIS